MNCPASPVKFSTDYGPKAQFFFLHVVYNKCQVVIAKLY